MTPAAIVLIAFSAQFAEPHLPSNVQDLDGGKLLGKGKGHGVPIATLRFSPDGKQLTSIGRGLGWGGELTWDLTKRTSLEPSPRSVKLEGEPNLVNWAAWRSPDGKLLLAWTWGDDQFKSSIVAFTADAAKRVYTSELPKWLHYWEGRSAEFSPDGKTFLRTGESTRITGDFPVYETATGKVAYTVKLKDVAGVRASFNADGTALALLTSDHQQENRAEVIVIDTKTGKEHRRLAALESTKHVFLLDDGRVILVLGTDNKGGATLSRWGTQTGKVLRSWSDRDGWLFFPANSRSAGGVDEYGVISADRRLLGCVIPTTTKTALIHRVHVIETDTLTERVTFAMPRQIWGGLEDPGQPTALAFSPDNRTLAVGLNNGTIVLYDIPPAKPKK